MQKFKKNTFEDSIGKYLSNLEGEGEDCLQQCRIIQNHKSGLYGKINFTQESIDSDGLRKSFTHILETKDYYPQCLTSSHQLIGKKHTPNRKRGKGYWACFPV